MEKNNMKKLLSLFCAIIALSGCSALSESSLFGGSECESKMARDFMENAEDRVFFAFDSSAISPDAAEVLDTQVKWLKKHDEVKVVVQGYCDERGTREYNLALGERRANAVKQYLISKLNNELFGKIKQTPIAKAGYTSNLMAVKIYKRHFFKSVNNSTFAIVIPVNNIATGDIQFPETLITDWIELGNFNPKPVKPKTIPINISINIGFINDFKRELMLFFSALESPAINKTGAPYK